MVWPVFSFYRKEHRRGLSPLFEAQFTSGRIEHSFPIAFQSHCSQRFQLLVHLTYYLKALTWQTHIIKVLAQNRNAISEWLCIKPTTLNNSECIYHISNLFAWRARNRVPKKWVRGQTFFHESINVKALVRATVVAEQTQGYPKSHFSLS